MTGRIHYTPEAEQQLNQLDEWITEKASVDIARCFVSAIIAHCEGIAALPLAGRACEDVRPGIRTSTYIVVNILGVFHGGQDWQAALGEDQGDPEAVE